MDTRTPACAWHGHPALRAGCHSACPVPRARVWMILAAPGATQGPGPVISTRLPPPVKLDPAKKRPLTLTHSVSLILLPLHRKARTGHLHPAARDPSATSPPQGDEPNIPDKTGTEGKQARTPPPLKRIDLWRVT